MPRRKKKKNVPNVPSGGMPLNQNNALTPLQNIQNPTDIGSSPVQYIPPTQPAISSPQTRIDNARFPRARRWWEGVKAGIGGTPEGVEQYSTVTPEQESVLKFLQQLGVQGLENPYGGFAPLAQQATNEFYQQTVPSLAHRFTSLGNASLSSPDFASQLGQAGAGLQQNLAAQQAEYGQQNIGQILQMLQLGLNPYTENVFRPAQTGLARSGINALLKGLTLGQGF